MAFEKRDNRNLIKTNIYLKNLPNQSEEELTQILTKKMKEFGNICDLHLYEDEEHGFFNYGRNSGIAFKDTMEKSYNFLKKIKFIK